MQDLRSRLAAFRPPIQVVGGPAEYARWLGGVLVGITLTAVISGAVMRMPDTRSLLLIAPIGGSAVLVFAAPQSAVAHPWAVIAGNSLSALIGAACLATIGYSAASAGIAVAVAIAAMSLCRCLHPPGGSSALAAVLGGPLMAGHGLGFIGDVVINSVAVVIVGLIFNNLTGRAYPPLPVEPASGAPQPLPQARAATVTTADLAAALALYDRATPMSERELAALYRLAEERRSKPR